MRKNFTLYPVNEAISMRSYVHETGKAAEFHEKGVKLINSFLSAISKPGQNLLHLFRDFKNALAEPQNLGVQKTGNVDVTTTLRNILREIYGKKFDVIDAKIGELTKHIADLETVLGELADEDVAQSIADLGKSRRQLDREMPDGVVSASDSNVATMPQDPAHDMWLKSLPAEGTPDWDQWVAKRAAYIGMQKEKAHQRGDSSKGDDLHSHDWWDKKAHWKQAHDEIQRYVQSGKDNKKFAWAKHYHDWRAYIGYAINEYYELKDKEENDFMKSIVPPKPKSGYM
jgi:hypothetical protein